MFQKYVSESIFLSYILYLRERESERERVSESERVRVREKFNNKKLFYYESNTVHLSFASQIVFSI